MTMQMLSPISPRAERKESPSVPAQAFQQCIDTATDKRMNMVGGARADQCSRREMKQSGNTITVDSVCNMGGRTQTSHAVMTGDFNAAYTVNVTTKSEDPSASLGFPDTSMMIEAKWRGPCKADQKPGDIIMANGMKMNVNEMPRGGPPGVPGGMKK